jgi:hypothetical protein
LREVAKHCEDDATEVEILWTVVLALLDCFIYIGYSFVEILFVEVHDRTIVIECGDMVVGELGEMGNSS